MQFPGILLKSRRLKPDVGHIAGCQACLGILQVLGPPEDGNDQVDAVACRNQAFLHFLLIRFLLKQDIVLAFCVPILEIQEIAQDSLQVQCLRASSGNGQHVYPEGILKLRLLIKDILDFLYVRILAQFQHDADSFLVGLVGDVHHIGQLLALHQVSNVHQELIDSGAYHGVGNLGDDKLVLIRLALPKLHLQLAAQLYLACPGLIDDRQFAFIGNDPTRGEIRAGHIFHELLCGNLRIIDICPDRVHHLTQFMGRDTGAHAYRDALCPVYQKVGHPDRQDLRLLLRLIVVGYEIYGLI